MKEKYLYVVWSETELGKNKTTGHWKIKYNNSTVGDMPTKESAIIRALAQVSGLGADGVILINPDTGEEEVLD